VTAVETRTKLDSLATELGMLSTQLAGVTRSLEPVEEEFTKFVDDFELGLYSRSIREDNFRLPAQALRHKLAIRAMPPELYGRYIALVSSRDRLRKRISDLKAEVDAQRSILSALKAEMEASG
jgi:hypothetical protein